MSTKEKVLKSAIELFSIKGFEGVSIREIADHAGVHFSGIRYHFGDKENLYKACLSRHGEARLKIALKYLSDEPKSKDEMKLRLSHALDETFQCHNENPFLSRLLLHEVENSVGRTDQVLKKTMVAMSEVYARFFMSCQSKGYISKELDTLFITQSLMGILHHFIRTENIRKRILMHSTLSHQDFRMELTKNIIQLYTR